MQLKPMLCIKDKEKFIASFIKNKETNLRIDTKYDGVRFIYDPLKKCGYSRNGTVISNFLHIQKQLDTLYIELCNCNFLDSKDVHFVFDGELIGESFQHLMTQVHRKEDINVDDIEYKIFATPIVTTSKNTKDFISILTLQEYLNTNKSKYSKVSTVAFSTHYCSSEDELQTTIGRQFELAVNAGFEGIVAKQFSYKYQQGKKSETWLKVKPIDTYDLKVVGYNIGINKLKNVVGALICEFGDSLISVGSGMTYQDREAFLKKLPEVIEVSAQGLTKDGKLRFPIFIRVRDDKNKFEVDNEA